ncbi:hypothetical protein GCM10025868_25920 [Angustibacter aerolatus]|uniref:Uncharacterized protein n=1 Tax=Angustibacter aerolatus TaxID=1162965 RepID=A0ABQ6JGI2_9ACTN|nr:hypothetical protein GCM10025868_25920 [Angustibacter aerolatus]
MMLGRTMLTGSAGAPGRSREVPLVRLLDDPLAHRLRERVGVGPAEAAAALAAGGLLLLAHPVATAALGVLRDGDRARPAVLALRRGGQPGQHLGLAGVVLDALGEPQPGVALGAPVDVVGDRRLGHRVAPPAPTYAVETCT